MILSHLLNMEQYLVDLISLANTRVANISCSLPEKLFYFRCLKQLPKYDYMVGFAALIESDAEGIGGSGFVECIREHMHSVSSFNQITLIIIFFLGKKAYAGTFYQGWHCQLTEEQFIAVKELVNRFFAFFYVKLFNAPYVLQRINDYKSMNGISLF